MCMAWLVDYKTTAELCAYASYIDLEKAQKWELSRTESKMANLQTETRATQGFTAGVKDYRLTYYMKDYQVHINDLLAAFRVA